MPSQLPAEHLRIGIDTGGTFTDIVCVDTVSGALTVTKVPSTPANPALGLVFPLAARAVGVVASIAGVYAVRAKVGETNALRPINRGFLTAGIITVLGTAALALGYVGYDHANEGW